MNLFQDSNLYKKLALQLLLVMAFFQLSRLLFFSINHSFFTNESLLDYASLAWHSMYFDLSTNFTINGVFLLFSLLPFAFVTSSWYQKILNAIFVLSNSIVFIFDLSDIGYFPYVRKRMTKDVFDLIGNKSDFIDLLPSYLIKFWFVPLAVFLFLMLFIYLNKKIQSNSSLKTNSNFSIRLLICIVTIGLSIVAIRGGLQLKPILPSNALLVGNNDEFPLIVNTPFSIIHSFEQINLKPIRFYSDKELKKQINPIRNYANRFKPKKCNVVVVILESFGKSYTGLGGRKSNTPFLDSLMGESLLFSNAFANAFRSADGIPACLASIPCTMDDAFITSPYSSNEIDALPKLLKQQGYATSFFHGGTNGTMSFDLFSKTAGFDKYVGRAEYNNDADYDGTWGIWDEPFLQFYANELSKEKEPFMSSVFTLSSHEPFKLPSSYKQAAFAKLPGIQRGISYTDAALRNFFNTAKTKAWFKNTLFVFTADHNYLSCEDSVHYYGNGMGLYSIPIFMFNPSDPNLKGTNQRVFQQINIMPTVLDYVGYQKSFFCYGQSGFDSTLPAFTFNMMGMYNQMLIDNMALTANETSITGYYNFKQDSLLNHKLSLNDSLKEWYETYYQSFRQMLNQTMLQNKQSMNTYLKQ